jgi:hypothetical protein
MKIPWLVAVVLAGILAGCATQPDHHAEYQSAFKRPLLSPGAAFGALPPVVQHTVIAEAGTEVIWEVVKDNKSGKTVYIIYFENQDIYPPLYVGSDGSVLNPDLTVAVQRPADTTGATTVKLTDLPPKVLEVIHEQASRSDVGAVYRATWGNKTVYIVTFKDDTHYPKLYVDADGNLLKDVQY